MIWPLLLSGVLLGILLVLLLRRSALTAPAPTAEPTPSPVPPVPGAAPTLCPDAEVAGCVEAFFAREPGRWSICWQTLPEGEQGFRATDRNPMVSASLIKLFVMGAVYEQIESGELSREAVYARVRSMITVSDNRATNELICLLGGGDETAGFAAVNDWCFREGYLETRLNRLMLAENGLQNYTAAQDCAALLASVYRGECVSPAASGEMLELLLDQEVNDRLPALLPTGTRLAHKTGDLPGLSCGDVGIVFSPGGDYVLCVIGNDFPDDLAARDAIAALSAEIYTIKNPQT